MREINSWKNIMCKNNSWKIPTRTFGEGVRFVNSDAPGQGREWFENPRFWRTSFVLVDGPLTGRPDFPTIIFTHYFFQLSFLHIFSFNINCKV